MTEPTSPTSEPRPGEARRDGASGSRGRPAVRRRDGAAGFTLIELTLALLIIGLLAALGLPRVLPGSGNGTLLRAETYRLAALLRADRDAALAGGQPMLTRIDAGHGVIRSDRGDLVVLDRATRLSLAGPERAGIRFEPDGRSSGGRIVLAGAGAPGRAGARTAYTILIEPVTAGVVVATGAAR